MAEEANASSADDNRACSDGRSGKNKCGNGERTRIEDRGTSKKGPLRYGDRQGEKLLRLQKI